MRLLDSSRSFLGLGEARTRLAARRRFDLLSAFPDDKHRPMMRRGCPACRQAVSDDALKCIHCHEPIPTGSRPGAVLTLVGCALLVLAGVLVVPDEVAFEVPRTLSFAGLNTAAFLAGGFASIHPIQVLLARSRFRSWASLIAALGVVLLEATYFVQLRKFAEKSITDDSLSSLALGSYVVIAGSATIIAGTLVMYWQKQSLDKVGRV